ncbi:MAG: hypothetical protein ACOY4K_00610 [Pseudomonadota bacterium]
MQSYQLGQRFTTAGAVLNGGKAYFYLSGTTTLQDVYEDDGLTTPLANPVVADSAGFFPELVYLDPTKEYRLILKTSAGVTIDDADPINTVQTSGGIDGADINADSIPGTAMAPGAVEDALGYTPTDEADFTPVQTITTALTGMIAAFLAASAPTGWVKANGGTIGSASSGATTRANADCSALFAMIWALDATEFPITDSGGGASTRGASAAADFSANKRLPLPDMRAEFLRGYDDSRGEDSGRVLGSDQAGQMPAHTHTYFSTRSDIGSGGQTVTGGTGSGSTTGSTGGTENSSENRPRNVAALYCIKL